SASAPLSGNSSRRVGRSFSLARPAWTSAARTVTKATESVGTRARSAGSAAFFAGSSLSAAPPAGSARATTATARATPPVAHTTKPPQGRLPRLSFIGCSLRTGAGTIHDRCERGVNQVQGDLTPAAAVAARGQAPRGGKAVAPLPFPQ